ncbi:hypothetical protein GGR23_003171 [Gellertiella hungarica]|uniref:Uncharacterized protein n=1 Tax=Gellertiella hungarica TaxID=1572859 RepID=A0A7W6NLH8_9HYPH|nr:hypothetical protein [Gellertiella hungarica]MBB4065963.1 hypothetical protein [Gellertiella hungarica]
MAHRAVHSMGECDEGVQRICWRKVSFLEKLRHVRFQAGCPFQNKMDRDLEAGVNIADMPLPLGKSLLLGIQQADIDQPSFQAVGQFVLDGGMGEEVRSIFISEESVIEG